MRRPATREWASRLRDLICVGKMKLASITQARRPQGKFPGLNQRFVPDERPEEIGLADIAVIEPIPRVSLKCIGVERPATEGNRHANLPLFIPLAVNGSEIEVLIVRQFSQRTGQG